MIREYESKLTLLGYHIVSPGDPFQMAAGKSAMVLIGNAVPTPRGWYWQYVINLNYPSSPTTVSLLMRETVMAEIRLVINALQQMAVMASSQITFGDKSWQVQIVMNGADELEGR